MKRAGAIPLALLSAVLSAQFPGQPRNQGPGIPFPKMPKKNSKTKAGQAQRLTRPPALYAGHVEEIVEEHILVRLTDARLFTYHTDPATKYLRNGDPFPRASLKPGDQVEVTAHADSDGYFYAESVALVKPAGIPEASAPQPARESEAPAIIESSHPAPDDDAAPRLRRRKQRSPQPAPSDSAESPIEKARHVAMTFTESLPNYLCRQVTTRFAGRGRPTTWHPLDRISAELVFEDGKEHFRNLTVNGKPANKPVDDIAGTWSNGEFASVLFSLFSPSTAARFHFQKSGVVARRSASIYDFEVGQPRSQWRVQVGGQVLHPAYRGSLWIDTESSRVLRIQMRAVGLPPAFPLDSIETSVDYEFVRLGDANLYLLPVRAEHRGCTRGTQDCTRNSIEFLDYRKYSGQSTIIFSGAEKQ